MIKKVYETVIYKGWLKVLKKTFSDDTIREVIHGKDAAAVGIYNSTGMVLVRQYRGAIENYTWEIPAGIMDKNGEDPIQTAIREVEEETSIKLDSSLVSHFLSYYPSIGYADNILHLYTAKIPDNVSHTYSITDEDVIDTRFFDYKKINNMINDGKIVDGKTIITFYKLKDMLKF